MVLDAIHALQYLWAAGDTWCPEGSVELEQGVLERFEPILEGGSSDVAAGMRGFRTDHEYEGNHASKTTATRGTTSSGCSPACECGWGPSSTHDEVAAIGLR
jgi:hypothetical protein